MPNVQLTGKENKPGHVAHHFDVLQALWQSFSTVLFQYLQYFLKMLLLFSSYS